MLDILSLMLNRNSLLAGFALRFLTKWKVVSINCFNLQSIIQYQLIFKFLQL
jgi:hypothetical protein